MRLTIDDRMSMLDVTPCPTPAAAAAESDEDATTSNDSTVRSRLPSVNNITNHNNINSRHG